MMTTADEIRAMTPDQRRDWLAEQDGWRPPGVEVAYTGDPISHAWNQTMIRGRWSRLNDSEIQTLADHPYPATLDGAAKALPEGYAWAKWGDGVYVAQRTYPASVLPKDIDPLRLIEVLDTGDECNDRYLLACLARVAEQEERR